MIFHYSKALLPKSIKLIQHLKSSYIIKWYKTDYYYEIVFYHQL